MAATETREESDRSIMWLVHWPGKTSQMCHHHMEKAKAVAETLGFTVAVELARTPGRCGNCENEAAYG